MKIRVLISTMMALCFMCASSAPINQAKAKFIAERFLGETRNRDAKSLDLKSANIHADVSENKPYYVFNAENGGFVIVSGDDNARQILGYSDSGTFGENIPPQLQELLNEYATQISNIPADAVPSSIDVKTSSEEKVLQTANWGQYAPYNDLCPNGYPTGCVATAMAIVMKYHNWPQSGTGSHSYEWNGQTISYDFSQTFDWDLMRNSYYSNNYSEAEGKAVAELMKACGVSVEMNYAADGSSASISKACSSLISFFKYDSRCECIHQDDYNYDEWASMIKSEIDANRPIIYCGEGQGSHAFVCDGYDANDMYHFNWGWAGSYNGFFALSALTPGTDYNFSYSPWMIINIIPEIITLNGIIYELFVDEVKVIGYENGIINVTIPESIMYNGKTFPVTSIKKDVFYDCKSIISVVISNSVKSIGDCAFAYCSNLVSIDLGDSVENIERYAFCYGAYTSIEIPESVKKVGDCSFFNSHLETVIARNNAPAEISKLSFRFSNPMTLYVPTGSKSTYETTDYWKNFSQIIEVENIGGIDGIVADETNNVSISVDGGDIVVNGLAGDVTIEVYNTSGQMLYCGTETSIQVVTPGIYIVKVQNKTFKVALK